MGESTQSAQDKCGGRIKVFRLSVSLSAVFALVAVSLPAGAAVPGLSLAPKADASSAATCFGSWTVSFEPGLGAASQEVNYETRDAPIHCVGAIEGAHITGPATMGQRGRIKGTVLAGRGLGTSTITVPTANGLKSVSFDHVLSYGPGIGVKRSDALAGPYIFTFLPVAGDGVVTPVTEIMAVGEFTLNS